MSLVKELYEPYVLPARARISTDPVMRRLVDPAIEPAVLERFFIQYHSFGVYMTEPVEGWIRRAGQRCLLLGMDSIGKGLLKHAKQEAGHHQMMIDDVRMLVRRWNIRRRAMLHTERLLAQYPTDAMRAYRHLHEATIAGELPAAQIAIEFEIENLSLVLGPHLLSNVARVLGRETLEGLSFLKEHVQLEVGGTNARMMEELLQMMPENARTLAETGSEALDIYLRFLGDCLQSAEAALWSPQDEAVAC
ncbi:hypothetical protein BO221_11525 [Archangium sp. Cb G35]|uniref:hypothetical protein n=1 Tax=Archangium sp. Cb G35 TaxID=1920190 RepID=UPI00093619E0|nr:hypothetical protein [Archangium sp. Cb G35]OJT25009.1 hypothetical protein BO221_11525 [Archangium sp. Cb G35]